MTPVVQPVVGAHRPSPGLRILGALGIVGGAVLLAAFLPAVVIPSDLNIGRLVLFNVGAMAVAVAAWHVGAVGRTRWTVTSVVAVVVANAWHLGMTVVATTREAPFAGTFGVVYFWAGLAMWVSAAWLGLAILRGGVLTRWGALALAVGSPLAVLGMSRLELTSSAHPTIVGPIALLGIALNGLGWVVLGVDIVRRSGRQSSVKWSGSW